MKEEVCIFNPGLFGLETGHFSASHPVVGLRMREKYNNKNKLFVLFRVYYYSVLPDETCMIMGGVSRRFTSKMWNLFLPLSLSI